MEYITPTEGYPSGMSNAASSWPPASTAIDFPAFQAMLDSDPTLRSGPGSITWQVNGELAIVAGWGYAVLMQVAHPMIAEGVARHSTFSHSPAAKLKRFMRTLEQMLRLTFGTPHEVWQAAQRIDRIHDYVHGQMDHSHANVFDAGETLNAGRKRRLFAQGQHRWAASRDAVRLCIQYMAGTRHLYSGNSEQQHAQGWGAGAIPGRLCFGALPASCVGS
jgi:hypothetical protein